MSVFVSIACLGIDQELIETIKSCFDNATNPDDVHMGIAFIGNDAFRTFINLRIESYGYKNIRQSYSPLEGNLGVGRGRLLAASLYRNEDYFMQVDAHSLFEAGWDIYFIDKFEKAKNHVNNKKVVLSGYPGSYGYDDENNNLCLWTNPILQYPHWIPGRFRVNGRAIPSWSDRPPWSLSADLWKMVKNTGFAPLGKICAAFLFSDKQFVDDNLCIEPDSTFWEEEVAQSINIFDNGYTLLYPGSTCKVFHYYTGGRNETNKRTGNRQTFADLIDTTGCTLDEYFKQMEQRFYQYIFDPENRKKIRRFEDYNSIGLTTGATDINFFPKYYLNQGKNPIKKQ